MNSCASYGFIYPGAVDHILNMLKKVDGIFCHFYGAYCLHVPEDGVDCKLLQGIY